MFNVSAVFEVVDTWIAFTVSGPNGLVVREFLTPFVTRRTPPAESKSSRVFEAPVEWYHLSGHIAVSEGLMRYRRTPATTPAVSGDRPNPAGKTPEPPLWRQKSIRDVMSTDRCTLWIRIIGY